MYTLNEYLPIFVGDDLPEKGWDDGMYCLMADEHVTIEAPSVHDLVRTSNLSIAQIGDRLHFADTPSFSKFFSRMKGLSPREYRES